MIPTRAWVRLVSGRRINLLDPQPDSWTGADLAIGLSRTYRWGGHSIWNLPLSVAQHSLLVLTLRERMHGTPLTRLEGLRELLHDASEGLLSFDPISPVKPHLGTSFTELDARLQRVIAARYDLRPWSEDDYAAHKRADRLAAASEALHVGGWSRDEIRGTLLIGDCPLIEDSLPDPEGPKPWEPWPAPLAAFLFLAKLRELLADEPSPSTPGNLTAIVARERTLRRLAIAFSFLPIQVRDKCPASPVGCGLHDTFVYAEADDGSQSVEGIVVAGERDETGAWVFEEPFKIFTTDEDLLVCQGYNCHVEIQ
jgi:hypothetical protein